MGQKQSEIVVITGASAGVGRATARAFGAEKAWVGLISRNRERLEAAKREIEEAGGRALVLAGDVADPEHHERAAEQVEREFGPIDIWVNDAMTTVFAPFLEIQPDEYRRATEVTYLGFVWGTRAALKRMVPRDRGTIVQVGSALAYRSIPLQSAYCGAKHAIVGFTDSVRSELLHRNSKVHLTVVQMPALNTPQFDWCRSRLPKQPQPVPPIFQPEVAARAIVWAAHHRRRELWVGSSTVKAIVGERTVPGYADRYLGEHGFDSQQAEAPLAPNRPDNLFDSVPGPYGAHGRFDTQAAESSPELWAATHRKTVAGAALAAVGLAAAGILARRR